MRPYLDLLRHILAHGKRKPNRTGIDTIGVFGTQTRYDLRAGFPAVTTKRLAFKSVAGELAWILSGSTDVKDLQARGVTIWDEWATPEKCAKFNRRPGELGPVYGEQLRAFASSGTAYHHDGRVTRVGFDQLAWLVNEIKMNPSSRRLLFSLWNPYDAQFVELPPCHVLAQFFVSDGELSCQMYQRSADTLLGVPFNIASYALLTHLLARECGLVAGEFVHTIGDAHLYVNHIEQVHAQLAREPRPLPRLVIDDAFSSVLSFDHTHVRLDGYDPHPAIKADVAV